MTDGDVVIGGDSLPIQPVSGGTTDVSQILITQLGQLVVIDFEGLQHQDDGVVHHGDLYTEEDFNLEWFSELVDSTGASLCSVGTLHPSFSGSTALFNALSDSSVFLEEDNFNLLDLVSIDLTALDLPGFPVEITFAGFYDDDEVASRTIVLDGVTPTSETFFFDAFTHLDYFEWTSSVPVQFDNIQVIRRFD